ncbi:helix-turn-helix domain-containing protein [Kitasatospora sp. NPDC006697]|uniref:helix-turn-helix domain-containing protein n=1 Tax=Kitasatospora sp. NPDC006697 TaxID=3364020 RepID=UPI0036AD6C00
MSLESPTPRRRLLDDPRSIRALAHPIRLQLQSIIGRAGRITAADAARELGISHGLASHHLRQLAKYGFVQQVDGADNRERPWQLVHTSHSVEGIAAVPGGNEALAAFEQVAAERALDDLGRWQEQRTGWSTGWLEHAGLSRSTVYLTEEEFTSLMTAFDALITAYVEQRPLDDLAARPPGSRAVDLTVIATPQDPMEAEQ